MEIKHKLNKILLGSVLVVGLGSILNSPATYAWYRWCSHGVCHYYHNYPGYRYGYRHYYYRPGYHYHYHYRYHYRYHYHYR